MFKGYKMMRCLFIVLSLSLFLQANPYKELDSTIKLNLMINYFLNEELRKVTPLTPVKDKVQDDGLSLDPVKYERYYNYIQRIKAIHDSRVEVQKDIDEKYAGKVGFYNGKLKVLKRFYAKDENLNPLLQISINKAFKVVYGKPKLKDIRHSAEDNMMYGLLHIEDIYGIDKFEDRRIKINIKKDKVDEFLKIYEKLKIKVQFDYKNNKLSLINGLFILDKKEYKVNFTDKINKKIKLDIKINDDIFHLIKIKDKK